MLSREQILSSVWGYEHDPATNVVDVYVGYLRRKLGRPGDPAPIFTVRAVGYRLGSDGLIMRPALNRLAPVGLRWRLAGWVAVVTLICTGITFVAVYRGTGTQLRHQIDQEIAGDAHELSHNLALANARTPKRVSEAAARYLREQPFRASSTLLFAVVPGAGTSTNRPELFAQAAPDSGEKPADQARENRLSRQLLTAREGHSTVVLPDVGNLRLLKRVVRVPGGLHVTVGVGEPLAAVAHAQSGRGAGVHPRRHPRARRRPVRVVSDRHPRVASRCAAWPPWPPAWTPGICTTRVSTTWAVRAMRCACWPTPSTTCSTGSPTRSPASARSSPMPRTSCARR